MSVANEPEKVGLHDPTHYPPRRLHEKPERPPMPDDVQALRDETPETAARRLSRAAPRHSRSEPQRRRLESAAISETRASRGAIFGGTGRLAAAVGVSAAIALLFVTMMPGLRQPDGRQSFSAAVEPFAAALSQQRQGDDASRPALSEFQPLLAGSDTGPATERAQTDARQSDKVLQQFLQWRQKANPSAAAQ